jgi:hypothetical protein
VVGEDRIRKVRAMLLRKELLEDFPYPDTMPKLEQLPGDGPLLLTLTRAGGALISGRFDPVWEPPGSEPCEMGQGKYGGRPLLGTTLSSTASALSAMQSPARPSKINPIPHQRGGDFVGL